MLYFHKLLINRNIKKEQKHILMTPSVASLYAFVRLWV